LYNIVFLQPRYQYLELIAITHRAWWWSQCSRRRRRRRKIRRRRRRTKRTRRRTRRTRTRRTRTRRSRTRTRYIFETFATFESKDDFVLLTFPNLV